MTKLNEVGFIALMLLGNLGDLVVAHADSLADPTRPAPEWLAAQPGGEAVVNGDVAGLKVIVIGPSRKFAVIDGQLVPFRGTYNGARLVSIHPDGVVMQRDGSREKLSMSPAVEKRVQVSKPVATKSKSRKKVVNGEGQ